MRSLFFSVFILVSSLLSVVVFSSSTQDDLGAFQIGNKLLFM